MIQAFLAEVPHTAIHVESSQQKFSLMHKTLKNIKIVNIFKYVMIKTIYLFIYCHSCQVYLVLFLVLVTTTAVERTESIKKTTKFTR